MYQLHCHHFDGLAGPFGESTRNSAAKLTEGNKELFQTHWKIKERVKYQHFFGLGSEVACFFSLDNYDV